MKTYKLLRVRKGRLYPLFVEAQRELPPGIWLDAHVGELADKGHVRSRLGPLALRPGWHSCKVPFTDWIGRRTADGSLVQRADTVWAECEVDGAEVEAPKRGLRTIPQGWYPFRTKAGQPFPWVISGRIRIMRILTYGEVEAICRAYGVEAQEVELL